MGWSIATTGWPTWTDLELPRSTLGALPLHHGRRRRVEAARASRAVPESTTVPAAALDDVLFVTTWPVLS